MKNWLKIARGEVGVAEIVGVDHNDRVLEYHSVTTLRATSDEVPWCASFVSWVMEQAGLPSQRSARARDWETYGQKLDTPLMGCIVVFWRKSRSSGSGHVGFYMGKDRLGRILVLGGNQSNEVNISAYDPDQLLGYRWPEGVPLDFLAPPRPPRRLIDTGTGKGGFLGLAGSLAAGVTGVGAAITENADTAIDVATNPAVQQAAGAWPWAAVVLSVVVAAAAVALLFKKVEAEKRAAEEAE